MYIYELGKWYWSKGSTTIKQILMFETNGFKLNNV
jgi:hypothetical protein